MAVNDKQFNVQQERVQKIAESYEGSEKKEVAELYVDRIAKLKSAIMESQLTDTQKEEYLTRLDNYLKLVDANNIQRLRKEYEPLFKSMESTLNPEVKERAQDDRDAKLEDVADLKIRQELLGEWREATKFIQKYDSKKKQLDLLIKTKKLEPEGTVLEWRMTSVEVHTDFLKSNMDRYYEAASAGDKHDRLKAIIDQSDAFYEVLTDTEKFLKEKVQDQADLPLLDINDQNGVAEQMMLIRRKRLDDSVKRFWKKVDALKIPRDSEYIKMVQGALEAYTMEFDAYKQLVFAEQDPAKRLAYAQNVNVKLKEQLDTVDSCNEYLDTKRHLLYESRTGIEMVKLLDKSPQFQKLIHPTSTLAKGFMTLLLPQVAVYGGYGAIAAGDMKTEDKVLEGLDFGISLVPIAGGVYDIVAAFRGKTLSGREMGMGECVVRGVIGLGCIVLDIFTFGAGGLAVKTGAKAVTTAGVKVAARTAAKTAAEAGTKLAAKEAAEVGGRVVAREVGEVAAHEAAELAGKEAVSSVAKGAVESTSKSAVDKMIQSLSKESKEILAKGFAKGAPKAARELAEKEIMKIVQAAIEPEVKKAAELLGAKYAEKLAARSARIATRTPGLVNRGLEKVTLGLYKAGGVKSLEEILAKEGSRKALIESSKAAGKELPFGFHLSSQFVKEGEIAWGGIAKEMGKGWWHLHNPMEVLKTFSSGGKGLMATFKRWVKWAPGTVAADKAVIQDIERELKAQVVSEGKYDVNEFERLMLECREKPIETFIRDNKANPKSKSILEDKEMEEFFRFYTMQFPKSAVTSMKEWHGLEKTFAQLTDSTFKRWKMMFDSRKLTLEEFKAKYSAEFSAFKGTEEEMRALEVQYRNFQSLAPNMPVHVKQLQQALEAKNLSKEELGKIEMELNALRTEKAETEGALEIFGKEMEPFKAGVKSEAEMKEIWYKVFETMPEGNLKRSIVSECEAKGITLKDKPDEYKEMVSQLMQDKLGLNMSKPYEESLAKLEADLVKAKQDFEQKGKAVPYQPPKIESRADVVVPPPKPPEVGNVVSIKVAEMATTIIKERVGKSVPRDLVDVLTPGQLSDLKKGIEEKGKKAVIRETQKLGPQATEAEMRDAGKKAFDQAARQEIGDQLKGLFKGMGEGMQLGFRAKVAEYIKKGRFEEVYFTLIDRKLAESIDRTVYNLQDNGNETFTVIGVFHPHDKKWVGTPPTGAAA